MPARVPKVLSIEDHELFRDGLRQALTEMAPPVDVLEASLFEQGVATIREHEHELGLVLLDLNLPDGAGLEMLTKLREEFPLLPVAIVSGDSEDPSAMRRALQALRAAQRRTQSVHSGTATRSSLDER